MKSRISLLLTAALLGTACGASEGPGDVAVAFWTASKDGNVELAKTYLAEASSRLMIEGVVPRIPYICFEVKNDEHIEITRFPPGHRHPNPGDQ